MIKFFATLFFLPTVALASQWSDLEPYQNLRSKSYIERALKVLVKQDQNVLARLDEHFVMGEHSFKIFKDKADQEQGVTPEFEYFFNQSDKPQKDQEIFVRHTGLKDVRIVLDPTDGRWGLREEFESHSNSQGIAFKQFVQKVVTTLSALLTEKGAVVSVLRPDQEKEYPYLEIVEAAQELQPQILVALSFNAADSKSVVSFVPGCFLDGEFESERHLIRLVHSLVSGKLYESTKLGFYISQELALALESPIYECENDFGGNACPISLNEELGMNRSVDVLNGVAARNLFIQGVLAPAVVYTFPHISYLFSDSTKESLDTWAEKLGKAYFEALLKYSEHEGVREVFPAKPLQ